MGVYWADPGLWCNEDPRIKMMDMVTFIVIVRPSIEFESICRARVDSDYGWRIQTGFSDKPSLDADDKWDIDWWWVMAPKI